MLDRTIRVFVDINQISDVNEKDGYLTIQLWIYCAYGSPSAAWDPLEFGNTTEITVPQSTFWVADINVLDALEVKYESFERQLVDAGGVVGFWASLVTMNVACSFDITLFPFDEHQCDIVVGAWIMPQRIYRIDLNKIVEEEGDDGDKLKEELSAGQHFLVDTEMENGSHKETLPSISDEDIERGNKRREMDDLRREYIREKGYKIEEMWEYLKTDYFGRPYADAADPVPDDVEAQESARGPFDPEEVASGKKN
ncbi:acetylcholine receptor subunit alpha-type acr-16-like [Symsagittifera roscoffensis]|uniref:acetylcholine receptor subunit alpha-type acr-16-like n=1 Tax=Symsagittifera roscoffensis TaxID=84072 RepID=UPI00307C39ED